LEEDHLMPKAGASPQPMFDLRGEVALVTGGNGGIGLGMARGLVAAGSAVVILGTSSEKNAAAEAELRALGGDVLALQCDVSEEPKVEAAFGAAVERFGKVSACFANAGVAAPPAPFVEQTLDDWRQVMRVNLEGTFLTLRAAARHMVERGEGGSLVGISSLGALQGMPTNQAYGASKSAVSAIIYGLAVELARYGIRSNAILPGFTRTEMTPHLDTEPFERHVLRRVPLRRWGEPADFAGIAVFLASDESSYVTGESFVIDGGYVRF
jgi:NAD(P)-dependent dehydrogenase (short-subunit alcohol dehydrogenase family)